MSLQNSLQTGSGYWLSPGRGSVPIPASATIETKPGNGNVPGLSVIKISWQATVGVSVTGAEANWGIPLLRAQPNSAHRALARLETTGRMSALVTQNVDRLHQRAGHQSVIDLHGRLDQVICMECGSVSPRAAVQKWLENKNPQLQAQSFELAPDGDADLELDFSDVQVPDCEGCGGVLKPHVVFFGDSVEKTLVEEIMTTVAQSDGLLVVGSSLMVFSSFRFVRHAHQCAIPIAALNQGATRADELFLLKVARSSEALERLIPE